MTTKDEKCKKCGKPYSHHEIPLATWHPFEPVAEAPQSKQTEGGPYKVHELKPDREPDRFTVCYETKDKVNHYGRFDYEPEAQAWTHHMNEAYAAGRSSRQAEIDELTRKGEELCRAYGNSLMGIEKLVGALEILRDGNIDDGHPYHCLSIKEVHNIAKEALAEYEKSRI